MQLFLNSAKASVIKKYGELGIIDGITTNPSVISAEKKSLNLLISEICECFSGTMCIQVTGKEASDMVEQGRQIASYSDQIVIKVPANREGLIACKNLTNCGIGVTVTLCFSVPQAIMAASAGAKFISPFVARLDDIGLSGLDLIKDIKRAFSHNGIIKTKLLVASVRDCGTLAKLIKLNVEAVTLSPYVLADILAGKM